MIVWNSSIDNLLDWPNRLFDAFEIVISDENAYITDADELCITLSHKLGTREEDIAWLLHKELHQRVSRKRDKYYALMRTYLSVKYNLT